MPENIESHGKPRAFIARAILVAFVLVYVGLSIFVAVAATDTSPGKTTAHTSQPDLIVNANPTRLICPIANYRIFYHSPRFES